MSYRRVFKPSLPKRILGWTVILLFGALAVLLLAAALVPGSHEPAGDRWGAPIAVGVVLLFVLAGVAILRDLLRPHR